MHEQNAWNDDHSLKAADIYHCNLCAFTTPQASMPSLVLHEPVMIVPNNCLACIQMPALAFIAWVQVNVATAGMPDGILYTIYDGILYVMYDGIIYYI